MVYKGKVTIPGNVISIGYGAFSGCYGITEADFLGDAPDSFGEDVFDGCYDVFTIIYIDGKTGWTTPRWNSYHCYPKSKPVIYGDADGNGKINLMDVVRLRQYIHPSYTVTLGPQP